MGEKLLLDQLLALCSSLRTGTENNLRSFSVNAIDTLTIHLSPKHTDFTKNFFLVVSFSESGLWKTVTEFCNLHKLSNSDRHEKNAVIVIAVTVDMFFLEEILLDLEVHHAFCLM